MVKGTVQKVETLQDGSVKLSVYVNKEDIAQAFPLAYQEVVVSLPSEGMTDDKLAILSRLEETFERGLELLKEEIYIKPAQPMGVIEADKKRVKENA